MFCDLCYIFLIKAFDFVLFAFVIITVHYNYLSSDNKYSSLIIKKTTKVKVV